MDKIEIMAGAIAWANVKRDLGDSVNWREAKAVTIHENDTEDAQAALKALEEAGFAVVPVEPTHDMTAPVVPVGEDRTEVVRIYKAMLKAAQLENP